MENEKLASAISLLCDVATQHFAMTEEHTLCFMALQEVFRDRKDDAFVKEYRAKIDHLRHGEFGRKIAQESAGFQQRIQQIKNQLR